MQDRVPAEGHESPAGTGATEVAEQMLRAALDGETYDAVAARYGITRTGVERRIKALAARAVTVVGVDGINEDGAAFVRRLRDRRKLKGMEREDGEDIPVETGDEREERLRIDASRRGIAAQMDHGAVCRCDWGVS